MNSLGNSINVGGISRAQVIHFAFALTYSNFNSHLMIQLYDAKASDSTIMSGLYEDLIQQKTGTLPVQVFVNMHMSVPGALLTVKVNY